MKTNTNFLKNLAGLMIIVFTLALLSFQVAGCSSGGGSGGSSSGDSGNTSTVIPTDSPTTEPTETPTETPTTIPTVIPTSSPTPDSSMSYEIVDTGIKKYYSDTGEISKPSEGEAFYGQDADYSGNQPSYKDNGDGTITDLNTGLIWQKTPDFVKRNWTEAKEYADTLELAGYTDWRMPTIKELYSLIDFNGNANSQTPVPYINTDYFDFQWGDVTGGDRLIDAQYFSDTIYVGTVFGGIPAVFGVNFADGRIKGYPLDTGTGEGPSFERYIRCVRGKKDYGYNNFTDNGDGTITDSSTGLMWMKTDSGKGLNWEEALSYAENLEAGGYSDWRLPNAKELQSIVDYSRAPDAADPSKQGPAIDPVFDITDSEAWFWSGTTHLESLGPDSSSAVYVAFGRATGYMEDPGTGEYVLMNVHGAGAQRSDPKSGDPAYWPNGNGPQGDVIRIYNYARCVRGGNQIRNLESVNGESWLEYPSHGTAHSLVGRKTETGKLLKWYCPQSCGQGNRNRKTPQMVLPTVLWAGKPKQENSSNGTAHSLVGRKTETGKLLKWYCPQSCGQGNRNRKTPQMVLPTVLWAGKPKQENSSNGTAHSLVGRETETGIPLQHWNQV